MANAQMDVIATIYDLVESIARLRRPKRHRMAVGLTFRGADELPRLIEPGAEWGEARAGL